MSTVIVYVGSLVICVLAGLCVGVVYGLMEGQRLYDAFAAELKSALNEPTVTVRVKKVKTRKKIGKGIGAIIPGKLHHHGVHANEL